MNEHKDKIEELADRLMDNYTLEEPSLDFTSNILARLREVDAKSKYSYQPLISKKVVGFGFCLVFLVFVLLYSNNSIDLSKFSIHNTMLEFTFPQFNIQMPKLSYSSIVIFSSLLFTVLFGIQIISILKMHKRSLHMQ